MRRLPGPVSTNGDSCEHKGQEGPPYEATRARYGYASYASCVHRWTSLYAQCLLRTSHAAAHMWLSVWCEHAYLVSF